MQDGAKVSARRWWAWIKIESGNGFHWIRSRAAQIVTLCLAIGLLCITLLTLWSSFLWLWERSLGTIGTSKIHCQTSDHASLMRFENLIYQKETADSIEHAIATLHLGELDRYGEVPDLSHAFGQVSTILQSLGQSIAQLNQNLQSDLIEGLESESWCSRLRSDSKNLGLELNSTRDRLATGLTKLKEIQELYYCWSREVQEGPATGASTLIFLSMLRFREYFKIKDPWEDQQRDLVTIRSDLEALRFIETQCGQLVDELTKVFDAWREEDSAYED